nr:hypothetical protein [uncultured Desulfobacter sp.]
MNTANTEYNGDSLSKKGFSLLEFLSNLSIALWLFILLTATLWAGGLYVKNDTVYKEINYHLLPEWFGLQPLQKSWWIYLLLLLLLFLFINTVACIIKRLSGLLPVRSKHSLGEFFKLLLPSLIHCFFLILLMGFAVSECTGWRQRLPGTPGAAIEVDDYRIQVVEQQCKMRPKEEIGPPICSCSAVLAVSKKGKHIKEHKISMLHPSYDGDLSFHLSMAGKPKIIQGKMVPQLVVIIKKDYGLLIILAGDLFMCLFLLLYYMRPRKKSIKDVADIL